MKTGPKSGQWNRMEKNTQVPEYADKKKKKEGVNLLRCFNSRREIRLSPVLRSFCHADCHGSLSGRG